MVQVQLMFTCDMVEQDEGVLDRALAEILEINPGRLVGEPEITVTRRAGAGTIAFTILVRRRSQALALQRAGESILHRRGLQAG